MDTSLQLPSRLVDRKHTILVVVDDPGTLGIPGHVDADVVDAFLAGREEFVAVAHRYLENRDL